MDCRSSHHSNGERALVVRAKLVRFQAHRARHPAGGRSRRRQEHRVAWRDERTRTRSPPDARGQRHLRPPGRGRPADHDRNGAAHASSTARDIAPRRDPGRRHRCGGDDRAVGRRLGRGAVAEQREARGGTVTPAEGRELQVRQHVDLAASVARRAHQLRRRRDRGREVQPHGLGSQRDHDAKQLRRRPAPGDAIRPDEPQRVRGLRRLQRLPRARRQVVERADAAGDGAGGQRVVEYQRHRRWLVPHAHPLRHDRSGGRQRDQGHGAHPQQQQQQVTQPDGAGRLPLGLP